MEHTHICEAHKTPIRSAGLISCFLCPHPLLQGKRYLADKCTDQWLQAVPEATLTSSFNTDQAYPYSTCETE